MHPRPRRDTVVRYEVVEPPPPCLVVRRLLVVSAVAWACVRAAPPDAPVHDNACNISYNRDVARQLRRYVTDVYRDVDDVQTDMETLLGVLGRVVAVLDDYEMTPPLHRMRNGLRAELDEWSAHGYSVTETCRRARRHPILLNSTRKKR